jgi:hypothetical protein
MVAWVMLKKDSISEDDNNAPILKIYDKQNSCKDESIGKIKKSFIYTKAWKMIKATL